MANEAPVSLKSLTMPSMERASGPCTILQARRQRSLDRSRRVFCSAGACEVTGIFTHIGRVLLRPEQFPKGATWVVRRLRCPGAGYSTVMAVTSPDPSIIFSSNETASPTLTVSSRVAGVALNDIVIAGHLRASIGP